MMKLKGTGGIGGISGYTLLKFCPHFLPHISVHSSLEVETTPGTANSPCSKNSANGIGEVPIFPIKVNP